MASYFPLRFKTGLLSSVLIIVFSSFNCYPQEVTIPKPQSELNEIGKVIQECISQPPAESCIDDAIQECNQREFPELCEATLKVARPCVSKKQKEEREKCMNKARLEFDCSKSRNYDRCNIFKEIVEKGQDACKKKEGKEFDQCLNNLRFEMDCSRLSNQEACQDANRVLSRHQEMCKGKQGIELANCIQANAVYFPVKKMDCSKAVNRQECEREKVAFQACQGKYGEEFKTCFKQHLKKDEKDECAEATDPYLCRQKRARQVCRDKHSEIYRACMRERGF